MALLPVRHPATCFSETAWERGELSGCRDRALELMQIDRVAAGAFTAVRCTPRCAPRQPPQHAPISALIRPIRTNSFSAASLPHISRPHPLSPNSGQWHRVLTGRAQELWKTDRRPQNPLSHRHRSPPPRTSNHPPPALCTAASSATSDREPQRQPLRPRLRGETRDPFHASPNFFAHNHLRPLACPHLPANKDNSRPTPFHLAPFYALLFLPGCVLLPVSQRCTHW